MKFVLGQVLEMSTLNCSQAVTGKSRSLVSWLVTSQVMAILAAR